MMIKCSKCKKNKDSYNFSSNKSRKSGFAHYCKKCALKHTQKWYSNNRNKVLQKLKENYVPKRVLTPIERFNINYQINKETNCWEWLNCLSNFGYGSFKLNGINQGAHRVSYILFKGKIPKGMCVCHTCDNRKCVNPNHLWLGTQKDNMRDMLKKGRKADFNGEKNPNYKIDGKEKEIEKIFKEEKSVAKTLKKFNKKYKKNLSYSGMYRYIKLIRV